MYVAIIGAGMSGLAAIRHTLLKGQRCDAYEQAGQVGGLWNYTDLTDKDENGLPVQSAMYLNLNTNLPKEVMAYKNFPYVNVERSYIPQKEVLDYLNRYADHFDLKRHIQFYKYVTDVQPIENNRWNLTVMDAQTKTTTSKDYDAIFVCSGHHSEPFIPNIPGQDIFEGLQLHSKVYRTPEPYTDKTVLIVGAGYSGQDICAKISGVAKRIFITHIKKNITEKGPNVIEKDCVTKFTKKSVVFSDGSEEEIDIVVYSTGYDFTFPFLNENSGIEKSGRYIYPLYKHVVNANKPTMFFITMPFHTALFTMAELQVQFSLEVLENSSLLPSVTDMISEIDEDIKKKTELGIPEKHVHRIGDETDQIEYFRSMSDLAKIERIPVVISKMYHDAVNNYRDPKICYTVLDDENYHRYILEL